MESIDNKRETLGFIAISKNAHPNCDGSPWGWIVLERNPCQQLVVSHNAYLSYLNK